MDLVDTRISHQFEMKCAIVVYFVGYPYSGVKHGSTCTCSDKFGTYGFAYSHNLGKHWNSCSNVHQYSAFRERSLFTGGGGDFEGGALIFGKSPMGGTLIFGAKNFEKASETHFSTHFGQK